MTYKDAHGIFKSMLFIMFSTVSFLYIDSFTYCKLILVDRLVLQSYADGFSSTPRTFTQLASHALFICLSSTAYLATIGYPETIVDGLQYFAFKESFGTIINILSVKTNILCLFENY
jgi:hypothetical protein